MNDIFNLSGQVVVITGGGGVLCGSMAKACAKAGAKVAVLDLILDSAIRVAKEIKEDGGEAIGVACNVLESQSIEQACKQVLDAFGMIDILINGAGGNHPMATTKPDLSFFQIPSDAVSKVFNLNFLGTLLPSQVFGQLMAKNKKGVIVNISSMNSFRPLTRIPAYSAAKAAISNFTQWLAVHMAQEYSPNIRVNAIAPGFFLTDQNRFLLTDKETGELTPRGKQILSHTPLNRLGNPDDLTSTLLWLLSPASSFITGIIVPVDGGFSAYSGV